MKKYLILIIAIFCFINVFGQNIKKATLLLAPFEMTSIIAVSCDVFEDNYKDVKKVIKIKKGDYKVLFDLLNKISVETKDHIDTRGQLLITLDNKTAKNICFDKFGIFYDGSKYFHNSLLFQFILNKKNNK